MANANACLLAIVSFSATPAFAVLPPGTANTYNGSTAANGLSTTGNWDQGTPFTASGAGVGGDLLFTGATTGTTFTGTGGNSNMNAESYNVTNGFSYTLQMNTSGYQDYRLGYNTDGLSNAETKAAFTNVFSGKAQDLIYLSNGSALTFNATNTGGGIPATMNLRQSGNFNIGSGSVLTLNTVINQGTSGLGLNINGAGTTVFNAANTYTGLTTINGGTLQYGVNDALSSGAVTVAGGTLDLQSYTDTVGAVIVSGGSIIGSGTLTGASYSITGASTISAKLAGASGVAITAPSGTVELDGANSYAGATTVAGGGTLRIGNATALGTTAAGTTISSGAVIDLNGQAVSGETLSLSGTGISSAGAMVNTSGTSASLSGAVTLTGNTTIGAGDITLGDIGQSGTRSLTKVGAGTLTFGGTNSYTGGTIVSEGTIEITSGNGAGGSFTLSLGTGLTTSPVLRLSNVNALASSATLSGANSAVTAGTLDLAAAGTYNLGAYTGNNMKFTASSGNATTLNFANDSVVTSGTNGGRTLTNSDANLTIAFGGTLDIGSSADGGLTITGSGNTTVAGAVFNNGAGVRELNKSGSGTLTLNGDNSYNGVTDITGTGKLVINGNSSTATGDVSVAAGATLAGIGTVGGATTLDGILAPGNGSIGTLTIANAVTWSGAASAGSTSDWQFELGLGNTSDLLSITGGDFNKGAGDVFRFDFRGGTDSGTFTLVDWTGNTTDFSATDFSYTNLGGGNSGNFAIDGSQLKFTVVPEPAAALLGGVGLLILLRRRRSM